VDDMAYIKKHKMNVDDVCMNLRFLHLPCAQISRPVFYTFHSCVYN